VIEMMALMIETDKFEKVEVESLAGLRDWLKTNHAQEASVWMVRFQKSVPAKYVSRLDALDELLCFGWIDGLARKLDDERTMQLISPRRQQAWAQSYKDRVARLEQEGRMEAPGRAAIQRSQELGLWDAYAEIDALQVPDDLQAALTGLPQANQWFDNSAPSYRRNVLRWIASAKTLTTRVKRIEQTSALAKLGEKVSQM
jgi:uncharacterized protein YdeI (YjbR/CyaY-like superfamily)